MDFLYFGTVGDADYNYWEMRELDSRLADLRLAHRIEQFSGGHGWMPRDLAMAAVEWMELRAMQAGSREVGPAFVDEKWARDLQTVATYEEGGRPLAASRRLEAMARDYRGLRPNDDLAMVAARSVRLAAEPGIRVEARAQQLAAAAHAERIHRAMRMIAAAFPAGAVAPAQPAATLVADLGIPELRAAAGRNDQAALAARRLIAELDVQTGFYLPVAAMQVNEDGRAAFYLEIARAIAPDDSFAWFLRAKIFARARNTTAAIDALRQAVNRGFRTLDALEHDPAFDVLRPRRDFLVLVEQVRAAWASDR
jgi:hypothetical protein